MTEPSLGHFFMLYFDHRGVDNFMWDSLEAVETKADHGAWFFSNSMEPDVG